METDKPHLMFIHGAWLSARSWETYADYFGKKGYEDLLRERGLEPFDAQDRVMRDGSPLAIPVESAGDRRLPVERVTPETADEWAGFLQRVYRLDTGPWLQLLIGRAGWHEYVAREAGEIVAARGMFIGPDGAAWLGMDAPVPGVVTDDYELDAALCAYIVADGLARGATSFLADIELPSPELDTPAYGYFARLGFRRPYCRVGRVVERRETAWRPTSPT